MVIRGLSKTDLEHGDAHAVLEAGLEGEVDLGDDLVAAEHAELVVEAAAGAGHHLVLLGLGLGLPLVELEAAGPEEVTLAVVLQRHHGRRVAAEGGGVHLGASLLGRLAPGGGEELRRAGK